MLTDNFYSILLNPKMISNVLNQSPKIIIPIKRKTAEVLDVVLDFPKNFFSKTEKVGSQWNSTFYENFDSKESESNLPLEGQIPWHLPLKIISIGADSKIVFDLPKSEKMTEEQYEREIIEIKNSMISLIRTIERE
jgi:hypothetical protein